MNKYKKHIFYFGLVCYAIAYLLPSLDTPNETMYGYNCFYYAFSSLFYFYNFWTYLWGAYWNLSNLFVLVNIYWFIFGKPKYGFIFAIIGISSAFYWIPHLFITEGIRDSISLFKVGYYMWAFSILIMSLHLFQKKRVEKYDNR